MKFSKEYIKECDCPEIQGLRPKMFLCEEYVNRDGVQIQSVDKLSYKTINKPHYRKYLIWLPTGDQLDEQIVKIFAEWSKDGEDLNYSFSVSFSEGYISSYEAYTNNRDCCRSFLHDNPLIAKIKLLKQLLEEK